MAVDVSPEILEEIEKNFEEYYKDPNVKRIYKKIVDGTATYSDMQILSGLVAKHIYQSTEKAYTNALESGKLPNDKLYQNIVDKTMRPTLKDGHGLIVEACGDVQTDLNRKSGIKLNAVEPELNESKVSGLIYQITNTNETKLSRTVLSGLIDTFCRSIVDDFVHANLDFQKESGLSPQISRTRGANSNSKCEYCAALVYTGEYKGPGMPAEIFRRHRYCHCNVLYNPMNGKKIQDVWSKQEYQDYREAQQKQRQYLNELDTMTPTERRLARNARARELRRAKYTPQEWERRKALERSIAETRTGGLSLEERKTYAGLKVDTEKSLLRARQVELFKKYGSEERLMIFGSSEELIEWGKIKNALGFNKRALIEELAKSADNWESILSAQTDRQMERLTNLLLDTATDEELAALNMWTGETYALINQYLRYGTHVDELSRNAAHNIEKILDRMVVPDDMIVRRGTGTGQIFKKMPVGWKDDPSLLVGREFTDDGFTATSPFSKGGFSGAGASRAELIIKVPKGTHGAYIEKVAHNELEQELLLQRGYTYRIMKAEKYVPDPRFPDYPNYKVWVEVVLK